MKRLYLLGLLVFSGFSGLAYELLWVRLLAANMGSTTLSYATVLSVFFGGLALGSRWAGARSSRSQTPVRSYALLEAATGSCALLLYPLLKHAGVAFSLVEASSGPAAVALRFVVATVLLLPPTFLMGATLPFICQATIGDDTMSGRGAAWIYGINTLGACAGVYLVTFHLLPSLGVFRSTLIAAAVNFGVAGVAFVASQRDDGPAARPADTAGPAEPRSIPIDRGVLLALLAALAGGLAASGAQVVWARLFAISLQGTSYGIGSVLATVLVGVGLGALLAGRLLRTTDPTTAFGWAQVVLVASLATFGPVMALMDYVNVTAVQATRDRSVLVHAQLLTTFLTLAIPTIASGAALPLLVARIERRAANVGAALSRVYAANTLGCIAGSVLAGYVLLPALGSNTTLYLMALVLVAAATPLLIFQSDERRLTSLMQVAALVAAVALYASFEPKELAKPVLGGDYLATRQARRGQAARLTFFKEGDIATVAVNRSPNGAYGLALNGLGQGSVGPVAPRYPFESVLVGAMPFLHHARPESGLVIGAGAGATVRTLLELGAPHVEVAELEQGVLEAIDTMWRADNPLKDERVRVIPNDARHHLLVRARRAPGSYSFITSMPAHPWVASALFTRDFFELAAKNLAPGGVFCTWFGTSQMDPLAIEALFGAFASVFPHVLTYWVPEAGAFYVVGSQAPLRLEFSRLDALAANPVFAGYGARPNARFFLARVAGASPPEGWTPTGMAIATDDNALIEFHGGLIPGKPSAGHNAFFPSSAPTLAQLSGATPAFLEELVEEALGTPSGRLPPRAPIGASANMLRGLSPQLEPELAAYVAFRLALLERKRDGAKALLERCGRFRSRCEKFLNWSEPDLEKRAAAMDGLVPQTADIQAALRAMAPALAAPLPPRAFEDQGDPLAWVLGSSDSKAPNTPDDARAVLRRLGEFYASPLFEACAARADEAAQRALALECRHHVAGARRAESRYHLTTGVQLGSEGKYSAALAALRRSAQTTPLEIAELQLLLRTALKVRDAPAIREAEDLLVLRGATPETIDDLKEHFRAEDAEEAR